MSAATDGLFFRKLMPSFSKDVIQPTVTTQPEDPAELPNQDELWHYYEMVGIVVFLLFVLSICGGLCCVVRAHTNVMINSQNHPKSDPDALPKYQKPPKGTPV